MGKSYLSKPIIDIKGRFEQTEYFNVNQAEMQGISVYKCRLESLDGRSLVFQIGEQKVVGGRVTGWTWWRGGRLFH